MNINTSNGISYTNSDKTNKKIMLNNIMISNDDANYYNLL